MYGSPSSHSTYLVASADLPQAWPALFQPLGPPRAGFFLAAFFATGFFLATVFAADFCFLGACVGRGVDGVVATTSR